MTDGDLSIEEKRVFSAKAEKTEVFVAADVGVVVVDVSADHVGGFGVDHRATARDVAGRGGRIAAATDEDVLLAPGYEATGFGPAVGVGLTDSAVVAVGEDGRVGTLGFDAVLDGGGASWEVAGHVDAPRAVDGRLVATASGVVRVADGGLRPAGLSDVADVAAAGPYAATGEGLFYLGNGWMEIEDGSWHVVDAAVDGSKAHAAGSAGLRRRAETDGGEWRPVEFPVDGSPVGFAYGQGIVCSVTADGTFLVDAGDGPRTQTLGVTGVAGIAIP
jgi:hypothetical protein